MRLSVVPILFALSAGALAQQSAGEQVVQAAMQTLNTSPTLYMELTGDEIFGRVDTGLFYKAYFQVSQNGPRVLEQIEVDSYNGNKLVMRLVGDGVTLWRYDFLNNQYSATVYGSYSGPQPADYSNTFLRYLSAMSQGYVSNITTLVRQIYGADGASYQSWMPGVIPAIENGTGNVIYSVGQPPRRTIQFVMSTPVSSGNLQGVNYIDISTVSKLTKNVSWSIAISMQFPDVPTFKFIPPAGSRAIAGPHLSASPGSSTAVGH